MTTRIDHASAPELSALLERYRDTHDVHYGAEQHTDHGPMVTLALVGLGVPAAAVFAHARRYESRLAALGTRRMHLDTATWQTAVGRLDAYPDLVAFFDAEVARHGWRDAATRYLPGLVSGWVGDAYHGLIRLGYGIELEVPSEVSAGLAYLAALGPDPVLVDLAARSSTDAPLEQAQKRYIEAFGRGTFAERYERVVASGVVAACMPSPTDALRRAARTSLAVFDSTHGFFALHLVTGSHAFRVCAPYAGPDAERLLWAGIIAGYLCIGAPPIRRPSAPRRPTADFDFRDDEHDIKLAFSTRSQAEAFDDPEFLAVGERYLGDRLRAHADPGSPGR